MWAFSIDGGSHMGAIIVGAGSVKLLLGSFLAEVSIDVTMFVRRSGQAALLTERELNE